jgi:hypothetical protein
LLPFINVPYDDEYETLYLALISGLSGFGLIPQAVLQIPGSERRLDRLFSLIHSCRYSFHDLCRVELDLRRPPTPRFNMPFELGLVVAWAEHGDRQHSWYVFEARNRRVAKSLSDLDGTQIYIHGGSPTGVLVQLANALARSKYQPTVRELKSVYRDLKKAAVSIKNDYGTLYDTRPFLDLVYAASRFARNRIQESKERKT